MKKVLLIVALFFVVNIVVDAQIFEEDFEDSTVEYTIDITECTDNSGDYLIRTDGTDIGGTYNTPGGTSFFAAQDLDASGCPAASGARATLTFSGIDITANTGLGLQVKLAEDDSNDGNEDWDSADFLHISASIDGGASQNLIWVESTSGTNSLPRLDTDFNGTGDGTVITPAFQNFSATISGVGLSLTITVVIDLDSGDEDIAIDDLVIFSNEGPLPVEMVSFDAIVSNKNEVDLSWITAQESNNAFFSIEHSIDGRDFTAIDEVEGAINSTEMIHYNYTHEGASRGLNYYRLRQVDTDGTFSFSPIEAVTLASNIVFGVRPTIVESNVTLEIAEAFDAEATIEIYNVLGRLVASEILASGAVQRNLNVSDLQSGHYFIRLINGSEYQTTRFIKR